MMQPRNVNTDQHGRYFSGQQKLAVWQKAASATGLGLGQYRLDACGALIEWRYFGVTTDNNTGWEIDHILPVVKNGGDELDNLQALQWQHNRRKGDSLANSYCFLTRTGSP